MITIQIEKEDIKLKNTRFTTFSDFIDEVEDYKFWKIISENKWDNYDISILEKKYLW